MIDQPRILALPTVAAIVTLFAAIGLSQDEIITLESTALGEHSRPLVRFPHERHTAATDCQICHHDFDERGANTGSEGQPCADCHQPGASQVRPALIKAFHLQCKGCHKKRSKDLGRPLPGKCGHCHVR